MMKLVFRIIINVLSFAISVGLAYFAVKLLLIFKGAEMETAWRYILAGVLAFATSSSIFTFNYILSLDGIIHPVAGLIMMVGGTSLLVGLYTEYKRWTIRRFFVEKFLVHPATSSIRTHQHAFSRTLGLNHQQLVGRKILLEFEPISHYEKAMQDLATEALANAEPIVILTRKGSAINSSLSEEKAVKFFCLTQHVSVPREFSENEMLVPLNDTSLMLDVLDKTLKVHPQGAINVIFDSLSDLVLSIGFEKTYRFMRYVTEMLASPRITALFLLNPSAHDPKVASSLTGLFSNQISFHKRGIQTVKLPEREAGPVEIRKLSA